MLRYFLPEMCINQAVIDICNLKHQTPQEHISTMRKRGLFIADHPDMICVLETSDTMSAYEQTVNEILKAIGPKKAAYAKKRWAMISKELDN